MALEELKTSRRYTDEQTKALEHEFDRNKYLTDRTKRLELSIKLNLTEAQVSMNLNILI